MHVELYAKFRETLNAAPATGKVMPYRWTRLPSPLSVAWLPYSQMIAEFASELSNSINELTRNVDRLRAWAAVVAPLSDDEKLTAVAEFINPLATVSANLPYVIRSRFFFATAHLCHQANRCLEGPSWEDNLPLDDKIYQNQADQYGKGWPAYQQLKLSLEPVASKAYNDAVHDFRHSYNHRFSPRFVVGITGLVRREVSPRTGEVGYAVGGLPPLDLHDVADTLSGQRDLLYVAFDAFQALVREHEAAIAKHAV